MDLLAQWKGDLDKISESIGTVQDASGKERRWFPVRPMRGIVAGLENWVSSGLPAAVRESTRFSEAIGDFDFLSPAALTRRLTEDLSAVGRRFPTIHVKLSSKRSSARWTQVEFWTAAFKQATKSSDQVPTLGSLVLHSNLTVPDWLGLRQYDPFLEDLAGLVLQHVDSPLTQRTLEDWGRKYHGKATALLKERFYPVRCDWRAFGVEEDYLRALVGAIVGRMVKPKSVARRKRQPASEFLPPVSANELDEQISTHSRKHFLIGNGDISAFTGNNVNTWAILLFAVSRYALGLFPYGDRIYRVTFGEACIVEVRVIDVFHAYLRTSVGSRVSDLSRGGTEFAQTGGTLGTNGNIVLCSYAFSLVAAELAQLLRRAHGIYLRFQIGGDDFAYWVICSSFPLCLEVKWTIHDHLRRFTGSLKEFGGVCVREPGLIQPFVYCKKAVTVNVVKEDSTLHIQVRTRRRLPTPSGLLVPYDFLKSSRPTLTRESAFKEVVSSVDDHHKESLHHDRLVWTYANLYQQFNSVVAPPEWMDRTVFREAIPDSRFLPFGVDDRHRVTWKVRDAAVRLKRLRGDTLDFPCNESERLQVLERSGKIRKLGTTTEGLNVWEAFSEHTKLRRTVTLPRASAFTDSLPIKDISTTLSEVRSLLE